MLLINKPKTEKEKEIIKNLVLEQTEEHEIFLKVPKDKGEQIKFFKEMIDSFDKIKILETIRENLRMHAPLFQALNMNLPVYISAEYGSEYDDESYYNALQSVHFYDENQEWIDCSEITFTIKSRFFDRYEEYDLEQYLKEELEQGFECFELEKNLEDSVKVKIWE